MSSPRPDDEGAENASKGSDWFQKIGDVLYGATIGLLKDYQDKSIEFAKLTAGAAYLHGVKTIRKYCLYLLAAFLMLVILAFAIVVVPLAFIALGPWSSEAKLIALAVFTVAYVLVPLILLKDFLSEKRWLQLSKSEKLVSHLTDADRPGE